MHVESIIDCLNKRRERAQPEEPESFPGLIQIFNENPSLKLTRDGEDTFVRTLVGTPGCFSLILMSKRLLEWQKRRAKDNLVVLFIDATYYATPSKPASACQVLRIVTIYMGRVSKNIFCSCPVILTESNINQTKQLGFFTLTSIDLQLTSL